MDKVRSEFEAWRAAYVGGDGSPFEYDPQEVEDAFAAGWQAALSSREGEAVAWGSDTHAELLAMQLASEETDDIHQLIWEGYPPEPWGEVWTKFVPEARRMIERVTAIATAPSARVAELERVRAEQLAKIGELLRRNAALEAQLAESREREGRMREALEKIAGLVKSAVVNHLMVGVQLGRVSWVVKMNDALDAADAALAADKEQK